MADAASPPATLWIGLLRVGAGVVAIGSLTLVVLSLWKASGDLDPWFLILPLWALFLALAVFFGWFALAGARTDVRQRMRTALRWAAAIGVMAFFVGGYLPCATGWGGNLCWLLGPFVTGPLGVALGMLLGWLMPNPSDRTLSALSWALAFEILLPLAGLLVVVALPGEPSEWWGPALLFLLPIGIALGMLLGWRMPHLLRRPSRTLGPLA